MPVTRRRRMSRKLIGILSTILALGLIFWLHNIDKNRAVRSALQTSAPLQPTALAPEKPTKPSRKPLVLETPTMPSTAPTTPVLLSAATTAPTIHAVAERTREA